MKRTSIGIDVIDKKLFDSALIEEQGRRGHRISNKNFFMIILKYWNDNR